MTLTQLSYVVAVAQHRHFGAASTACFVTQPTLSMQIQKLEDELGIEIFDRSAQPVKPTPLGEGIISQARLVLAEAEKIKALSAEEVDTVATKIHLGVIPTLSPTLIPKLVAHFTKHHPTTELSIEEVQTRELMARLKDGSLDVGLLVTPLDDPKITECPLFYEPFCLYVSETHALARKTLVSADDLSIADLWLLSEGHCFRDQALKICGDRRKRKSAGGHTSFESGSLETLKKMVDLSGGYTLLPALAARDLSEPLKRKQLREFAAPVPTREVSLVYSHVYRRKATLIALAEGLQKGLPVHFVKPSLKLTRRIGL